MTEAFDHAAAMTFIHERSGYDRGFISNPFAGDDAARLGLLRTEQVLEELGRPDRAYPILHVAGSKGKGSTSTMLASIYRASGIRCGRFLSPHLHRFNERFAVDDEIIPDSALAACVAEVRNAALSVEKQNPSLGLLTAWELSTAIALLWFSRERCDVVVLEVGMGGTLDATNVVQPVASLISRLDFEHTAILGNTIEEIAANKAGIIKHGAPAYTVAQLPEALAVLRQRAEEVDTNLAEAGVDWTVSGDSEAFDWDGFGTSFSGLKTSLAGRHQVENAGLAIAAVVELSTSATITPEVTVDAIRTGLLDAFIPGRFEVVALDDLTTVVIDGAHTPASAQVLADAMATRYPDHQVTALVAMLADKEPGTFLGPLVDVVDDWIVTQPQSPRALDPDVIAQALGQFGRNTCVAPTISHGLSSALARQPHGDWPRVILVTGSLSTVAEARSHLGLDRASS